MERGSAKHGPKLDDQMQTEVEGALRGNKPTRAHEELEPEPVTDMSEPSDEEPGEERPDRSG
ncbi:hypothetical protein [Marinitenerispora sediminis]|uniref:Uncharacterized protein n=1 Tax=Marinitenerispora sediminis TaxID=1931232 RepID=A0A368TB54_9ACTN|nr:hypothetical protein [Marinitenerispora sediminis]RCV50788.1 hypothetical protein DEF28_17150 [Marinitenerispora sediminis]RCV55035.1 hypothetical protein DEF23_14965 [Marinitenerispora sediminis]RCV62074.1 hypothetical protein DEF24_02580 [Marinitenerispora sediminis]